LLTTPFGNLIQTIDAVGNIVTATYDTRGRKTASSDPDLGAWNECSPWCEVQIGASSGEPSAL